MSRGENEEAWKRLPRHLKHRHGAHYSCSYSTDYDLLRRLPNSRAKVRQRYSLPARRIASTQQLCSIPLEGRRHWIRANKTSTMTHVSFLFPWVPFWPLLWWAQSHCFWCRCSPDWSHPRCTQICSHFCFRYLLVTCLLARQAHLDLGLWHCWHCCHCVCSVTSLSLMYARKSQAPVKSSVLDLMIKLLCHLTGGIKEFGNRFFEARTRRFGSVVFIWESQSRSLPKEVKCRFKKKCYLNWINDVFFSKKKLLYFCYLLLLLFSSDRSLF